MKPEMSSAEEILLKSFSSGEKLPNSYLRKILQEELRVKNFKGVFPCDRVKKLREGESLILNTDPHQLPGKHFVALTKKRGRIIYFDSLAEDMKIEFPELYRALQRRGMLPVLPVLKSPIQAIDSNFCGLFCIDYILTLHPPYSRVNSAKYELKTARLRKNDQICLENVLRKVKAKK